MELKNIKFEDFKNYLTNNYVFGFTAILRDNTIIYSFVRFFNKNELKMRVKVNRDTKCVESAFIEGKTYTDLEDVKEIVERRSKI